MTYIRSFEDFVPPQRFDSIPFASVEIQEAATAEGPFSTIETQLLSPIDTDPANPLSRAITTDDAVLDPGWYVLVWKDNTGASFASDPIFSGDPAPGVSSFITRSDLADYLHRPEVVDDDAALLAIDAACGICRIFAEQTFNLVSDDQIILDGTGTDALLLPQLPVVSVSSVTLNDDALTVDDDYRLNGRGVLLRPWPLAAWTRGRQNVSVTYTHGYAPVDLPREIRMVALSVAGRMFTTQGASVRSESLGAYRIDYAASSVGGDLTNGERAILRKYRR